MSGWGDGEWRDMGPRQARQCPECPWYAEEPPMQSRTVTDGMTDAVSRMTWQIRQRESALVAVAVHVLTEHPDSAVAALLRTEAGRQGRLGPEARRGEMPS